jgi:NADPH2:quinone reductase
VCIQPFGSLAPVSVGISTMFEVPDSMSDEDAAAFMIPAHTAWHAVHRRGQVQAGETVGVLGAAGGLGAAIVQLCVAAGCDVVAVVGGAEKAQVVEQLGARAVDHSAGDVVERVREATGGRGLDVIVDPVQGEAGAQLRDLLVPDGRHVLCGHAGGLIAHDPHFYVRNHTLVGATLGGYPRDEMRRIHHETQERIEALIADGKYRPLVSRCVDFADVPAAVTDLAERRTWGRVVVRKEQLRAGLRRTVSNQRRRPAEGVPQGRDRGQGPRGRRLRAVVLQPPRARARRVLRAPPPRRGGQGRQPAERGAGDRGLRHAQ